MEISEKRASEMCPGGGSGYSRTMGVLDPFPSLCLSRDNEKARHPPSVPGSPLSDPVSQILLQPRRAPGPHLPGELGQAISGSCSACLVLPTVPLTHTGSQVPWEGRAGGETGSVSP